MIQLLFERCFYLKPDFLEETRKFSFWILLASVGEGEGVCLYVHYQGNVSSWKSLILLQHGFEVFLVQIIAEPAK